MSELQVFDDTPREEAALVYAGLGWRLIPLHNVVAGRCSCSDPECHSAGKKAKDIAKHPRVIGWQNVATTDETTIRGWWSRWPDANIGIATGAGSGLLVLDVDVHQKKPGFASLAKLCAELGPLPPTPTVATGSGGSHFYFEAPVGFAVHNSTAWRGAAGIDWRSDGGQVVAPPSITPAGRYRWLP